MLEYGTVGLNGLHVLLHVVLGKEGGLEAAKLSQLNVMGIKLTLKHVKLAINAKDPWVPGVNGRSVLRAVEEGQEQEKGNALHQFVMESKVKKMSVTLIDAQ